MVPDTTKKTTNTSTTEPIGAGLDHDVIMSVSCCDDVTDSEGKGAGPVCECLRIQNDKTKRTKRTIRRKTIKSAL